MFGKHHTTTLGNRTTAFAKIALVWIAALTLMSGGSAGLAVGAASVPAAEQASKIVINIPSRTLWVYSGEKIVRYFPVGVGRPGFMTPLGQFKVIRKILDPGWENPYKAKGAVRITPGANNPLGTRWIGFHQNSSGEYGMHGTDNPGSVGKFSSHGCVRLKIPDAEALFELVEIGTPVEVVYEPVLIRENGNDIRLIVYTDRFKKGMPSVDKIQQDILKQYPGAEVDLSKIQAALQAPAERPVVVGQMHPSMSPVTAAEATQKELKDTKSPVFEPIDLPTPSTPAHP
jgi:hypothetical protein